MKEEGTRSRGSAAVEGFRKIVFSFFFFAPTRLHFYRRADIANSAAERYKEKRETSFEISRNLQRLSSPEVGRKNLCQEK